MPCSSIPIRFIFVKRRLISFSKFASSTVGRKRDNFSTTSSLLNDMSPTSRCDSQLLGYQDRYDYEPLLINLSSSKNSCLRNPSEEASDSARNQSHLHNFEFTGNRFATFLFFLAFLLGLLTGHDLLLGTTQIGGSSFLEDKAAQLPNQKYLSAIESLGSLSRVAIKIWDTTLMENFGVHRDMVMDKTLLHRIFRCSDASREKLTRKLMLKVLEVEMAGTNNPVKFTWVTAGDSSAAGHGNMYSQSYTNILEEMIKPVFDSVGITFIARNHAMAGIGSAPELSLCMESVYGPDVDMLMWDFGRAERLSSHRVNLFGSRAAVHPSFPTIMVMDFSDGDHWQRFQSLEELGLSAILMDEVVMSHVLIGRLPDSSTELVEDATEVIKSLICNGYVEGSQKCDDSSRNFVCDVEGGDICTSQKFNSQQWCPSGVRYQYSFNSGWKKHLFIGRFLALFLIEALKQALLELDNYEKQKPFSKARLQELYLSMKSLQDYDVNEFLRNTDIIEPSDRSTPSQFQNYSIYPHRFYRRHTMCRTALLPSQVSITPGLREKALNANDPTESFGAPLLTFDPKERQVCEGLNFDYKDYFAIRKHNGGVKMTIPNIAEKEAFPVRVNTTSSVLIMICLRQCDENLCPSNNIGLDEEDVSILVNEQPVFKVVPIEQCHLMSNEAGIEWLDGKSSEGVTLSFMVHEESKELQISSVVLIF